MLELEPPRHTKLRNLVLRAFTSRRIAGLGPEITALCHDLIDTFPTDAPFDLLQTYCQRVPVIIIARLLGVPESLAPDLLKWSNAMVMMYQAGRSPQQEEHAATAAQEFSDFLRGYVDTRRTDPRDDLISSLIQAESDGQKLTIDELITTCILLLNAGHEATVHSMGNGVKHCLEAGLNPAHAPITMTEEILRYDPPLHMFTRWAYEPVTVAGIDFQRGDQVGVLLASANRDPTVFAQADQFIPNRATKPTNLSFGAGLHFCIGAPLARLELQNALPILFDRLPNLNLVGRPQYANIYHFHGLADLIVSQHAT